MRYLLSLLLVLSFALSAQAGGPITLLSSEPEPEEEIDPDAPRFVEHSTEVGWLMTYHLTLTPRSPQSPVLRYSLLPEGDALTEGNAATQYHRAIQLMQQQTANMEDPMEQLWEPLESWRDMPLDQLPIEEMEQTLAPFELALEEAAIGARRTFCDWGVPFQEKQRDLYMITLPEIQEARNLTRVLTVRIRLRLAQGRFDEAIDDLQTGFTMARDMGGHNFLVGNLVGVALSVTHNVQLLTALTLEDAPNLYWSITNLPRPLVDFRSALELEGEAPFLMFPELLEARTETRDEAYWNRTLIELLNRMEGISSLPPQGPQSAADKLEATAKLAYIYLHVPAARKGLVETYGYSAEEVAQMPGSRVLLLYSGHTFERLRDKQFSLFGLPYAEANKRFEDIERDPADGLNVSEYFLPATHQVYTANTRNERTFALLRVVEALRDHVAIHGQVPASLDEVTNLPVPINPLSGEPFVYQVEDAEAKKVILETKGESWQSPTRLKITFRE